MVLKSMSIAVMVAIVAFPAIILGADFSPRDIYRSAAPAVVLIFATDQAGKGSMGSIGTGSVISGNGLVLTNSHVVTNQTTNTLYKIVQVRLKPQQLTGEFNKDLGRAYPVTLVAQDPVLDLAVLKIDTSLPQLPVISFGDSASISTGDPVAAIGHPEGGGLWTLTTGVISGAKKVGQQEVFQTEASTNRGNSGGPLLDSSARLIGVNTSMIRQAQDGMPIVGINFAVKSEQVRRWLEGKSIRVAYAAETPGQAVSPSKDQPMRPSDLQAPPASSKPQEPKIAVAAPPSQPAPPVKDQITKPPGQPVPPASSKSQEPNIAAAGPSIQPALPPKDQPAKPPEQPVPPASSKPKEPKMAMAGPSSQQPALPSKDQLTKPPGQTVPPASSKPEEPKIAVAAPPSQPASPPKDQAIKPPEQQVPPVPSKPLEPKQPAASGQAPPPSQGKFAQPAQEKGSEREFIGPNKERMYGVPDRSLNLDTLLQAMIAEVRANAASAFDELDRELQKQDFR